MENIKRHLLVVFLLICQCLQSLAKVNKRYTISEQFNLVFGSEMCKAFSELNDPIDQLECLRQQSMMLVTMKQMLDIDYAEALNTVCTRGFGYSDELSESEGITAREGVPFPQLKREVDEVTRSIYPDLNI